MLPRAIDTATLEPGTYALRVVARAARNQAGRRVPFEVVRPDAATPR